MFIHVYICLYMFIYVFIYLYILLYKKFFTGYKCKVNAHFYQYGLTLIVHEIGFWEARSGDENGQLYIPWISVG